MKIAHPGLLKSPSQDPPKVKNNPAVAMPTKKARSLRINASGRCGFGVSLIEVVSVLKI
jgi:hypothetical protein